MALGSDVVLEASMDREVWILMSTEPITTPEVLAVDAITAMEDNGCKDSFVLLVINEEQQLQGLPQTP